MYFEGRELSTSAEPVSSTELQPGEIYFAVNFVDHEMLIPIVETLVYIGRNLEPGDIGKVYFQDIESHREGVGYLSSSKDNLARFLGGSQNELGHIFTFEKALDVLLGCSLRRRNVKV
ncbi:MAG TPA: hypothetical protein VE135_03220 [Pyrinomonadaceae bacterium]|nr:hypothetical protein [Pyrinomonadaceae bacterium]